MFSVKALVARSLMALGKLLILFASVSASAEISNPRFFEYRSEPSVISHALNVSFGWFKTLDSDEKEAYYSSITHALMYAENGQAVEWYRNNASGYSVPVATWPTGGGYCRRLYIQVIAFNTMKNYHRTACFSNASSEWSWLRD